MTDYENNEDIRVFREYLRIPSVHPNIDYEPCLKFLKKLAEELEFPVRIFHPKDPKKPILVMTWEGTNPALKTIILNSHMDVVPVFEEHWTHPPFAAEIDETGKIFARGAQDMKCVGIQYLRALKALKAEGFRPKRTIHISFVPEEELGGFEGMMDFVKTEDFRSLNVGFSLDEGMASPNDVYEVFYGERTIWHVKFVVNGNPGHGSLLLKGTAGEKARFIIDRMYDQREIEVKRLEEEPRYTIGDVTTINLTQMRGGVQTNVVPDKFELWFDVRIDHDKSLNRWEEILNEWCEQAGGGIDLVFGEKNPYVAPTKLDASNAYWVAFKEAIDDLGLKIRTGIFTGGTDSRYIRELDIPALGFSPMINTPVLLHDHDEYLDAATYLRGIEIYKKIIPKLANVK